MARTWAVGDTFKLVRECDRYRPIYYAAASGDFNPIHIDPAVGQQAGLGGVILQGLCTLGWAVESFIGYLGDPGRVSGIRVRFSKPVAIDDTITYEGKVTSIEGGKLVAELSAKNQRGEAVLKNAVVEGRTDGAAPSRAAPQEPTEKTSPFVGRKYGPFTYEVGVEKLREFAYAVGGTVPSLSFSGVGAPEGLHPWLHDKDAGRASPYGSIVAMPNFAVVYAIAPFGKACTDPDLDVNLLMLVHGEQEFEFLEVVRPGDTISTTGEISELYSKKGLDFLTVTTESVNQHGRTVTRAKWSAVIRGK